MNTEAIRALEARYEAEIADLRAQLSSATLGGAGGITLPDQPPQTKLEAMLPPTAQPADHIPDAGKMVQTAQPAEPADSLQVDAAWQSFCRTVDYRRCLDWVEINEAPGALFIAFRSGLNATTQPQQSTQAVQPKIPPFIESTHSYKTVWTHLEAEQIEDYGRRCFAAGISAAQQPQQSAAINPTGGTTPCQ